MSNDHSLRSPLQTVGASGAPPFRGSWTNFAGFRGCSFWKDADGICHLSGIVTGGVGGYAGGYIAPNPIFQLPPGFRPGGIERFAAAAYPGGIKGAQIGIPSLQFFGSGADPQGGTTVVTGGTGPIQLTNPPLGSTWVDVLSGVYGGFVVAWMDATFPGFIVSLSGISFYADQ